MPDEQNRQDAEKYRIFKEADKRYAAKIFERAFIGILAAIGLAIIGAALKNYLGI